MCDALKRLMVVMTRAGGLALLLAVMMAWTTPARAHGDERHPCPRGAFHATSHAAAAPQRTHADAKLAVAASQWQAEESAARHTGGCAAMGGSCHCAAQACCAGVMTAAGAFIAPALVRQGLPPGSLDGRTQADLGPALEPPRS